MADGLSYVAKVGINYPDGKGGEKRVEPGEPVPVAVVKNAPWLLEQGLVEKAESA
jgi:hypothetical protein